MTIEIKFHADKGRIHITLSNVQSDEQRKDIKNAYGNTWGLGWSYPKENDTSETMEYSTNDFGSMGRFVGRLKSKDIASEKDKKALDALIEVENSKSTGWGLG